MAGDLMYPKQGKKRKRTAHPESILQEDDGTCYLCKKLNGVYRIHRNREKHHVFGGPNRRISEENGFTVKLCIPHHQTGHQAVHRCIETMRMLQKDMQREYEKTHTRQQFVELIGRNYLEEDN